jgi:hypothetical protein
MSGQNLAFVKDESVLKGFLLSVMSIEGGPNGQKTRG